MFKCYRCDADSRVIERRDDKRRRLCDNGHKFGTKEVDGKEKIFFFKKDVQKSNSPKEFKILPLPKLWG